MKLQDIKLYIGNKAVSKAYLGETKIYEDEPSPAFDGLCFTALLPSTIKLTQVGTPTTSTSNFETSSDGSSWSTYTVGNTLSLNTGDKVYWRGHNTSISQSTNNYKKFVMTGNIEASGSVMSLIMDAENMSSYAFYSLFNGCTTLTTAPELPATTLAGGCYYSMFNGCTSLVNAPELPATLLNGSSYNSMFRSCSNLKYVKALFTTTPSSTYTGSWVFGVTSGGTFVKSNSATWTTTGTNGVPNGWSVTYETAYINFNDTPVALRGDKTWAEQGYTSVYYYGSPVDINSYVIGSRTANTALPYFDTNIYVDVTIDDGTTTVRTDKTYAEQGYAELWDSDGNCIETDNTYPQYGDVYYTTAPFVNVMIDGNDYQLNPNESYANNDIAGPYLYDGEGNRYDVNSTYPVEGDLYYTTNPNPQHCDLCGWEIDEWTLCCSNPDCPNNPNYVEPGTATCELCGLPLDPDGLCENSACINSPYYSDPANFINVTINNEQVSLDITLSYSDQGYPDLYYEDGERIDANMSYPAVGDCYYTADWINGAL